MFNLIFIGVDKNGLFYSVLNIKPFKKDFKHSRWENYSFYLFIFLLFTRS